MLRLDAVRLAGVRREVPRIERGDDRRGQHVPITGIVRHLVDKVGRRVDERVRVRMVHLPEPVGERLCGEAWMVDQQVAFDLAQDFGAPVRLVVAVPRQREEEVGERDWVEDAGIQHDDQRHRASL